MKKQPKGLTLYTKVVLLITFVVFVSLLATSVLISRKLSDIVEQRMGNNSLSIASTVSRLPLLVDSLDDQNKKEQIQSLITAVSTTTNSNIVIFDMKGKIIAYNAMDSHTKDSFLQEAQQTAFTTPNMFTMGENPGLYAFYASQVSNKILDNKNQQIGVTVVGLPSDIVTKLADESMVLIFLANAVGLIVGICGSLILVKNIKDTLFGLEPETIAKILQERSAMLDSVQEGILSVDIHGIITLVNVRARNIFEYAGLKIENPIGMNIEEIYRDNNMQEILLQGKSKLNHEESINNITVITNQVPVIMEDKIVGAITTFRRKTEVEELAQQLTGVRNYADALRAQTHEFMNKLHVVLGLTEMQAYDELRQYVKDVAGNRLDEAQYVNNRLKDPVLSGFILGKLSRARELDIDFSLTEESNLPAPVAQAHVHKLIIIIGNLIDNAFDALKNKDGERIVLLTMLVMDDDLVITVEDSGVGISDESLDMIFSKGYSSKGLQRGFGLYLVKQTLDESQGSIEVETSEGQGTVFIAKIPYVRKVEV